MDTEKSLGQINYEAFHTGSPHDWTQLNASEQTQWDRAAAAVVEQYDPDGLVEELANEFATSDDDDSDDELGNG